MRDNEEHVKITKSMIVVGATVVCVMSYSLIVNCSRDSIITDILDRYESLNEKIKNIKGAVATVESTIAEIKNDIKDYQDNAARIYTNLACLQKDLAEMKDKVNMQPSQPKEHGDISELDVKNMSPDEIAFIESLENLINEGLPFDEFLSSNAEKFDVSKYSSGKELQKLAKAKVKTVSELQKDFANIGASEFDIRTSDSFWDKQKKAIKNKILSLITIKKNSAKVDTKCDDKTIFSSAFDLMEEKKLDEAVAVVREIKHRYQSIMDFVKDAQQRIELTRTFADFKKSFVVERS